MIISRDLSAMEDQWKRQEKLRAQLRVLPVQKRKNPTVCFFIVFCILLGVVSLCIYGYITLNNRLRFLEAAEKRRESACKKVEEIAGRTKRSFFKQANTKNILTKLSSLEKRLNQSLLSRLSKTVSLWRGPPGIPGRDGRDGSPGRDGRDGTQGPTGEKGMPGAQGPQGQPGHKGTSGSPGMVGVTYIRWGRKSCPNTGATIVYEGIAGGSRYTEKGGASNYVCLPRDPVYEKYVDGVQSNRAYMYGSEYESRSSTILPSSLFNHEVPCVRCHVSTRVTQIMVPGTNVCPAGWTLEYKGYLMAENHKHHRTMFTCVDDNPEYIPGTQADKDGALLYYVEGRCGSLPCRPYIEGRELTCAVCTR